MILKSLFSTLRSEKFVPTPPEKRSICFISATRSSEEKFWNESPLGTSLKPLITLPGISAQIAFENQRGLPAVYNPHIQDKKSADILVFLHDDVWLFDDALIQKIRAAHEKYDIVGVAGNTRWVPTQPAWLFHSINNELVLDAHYLSGAVAHGHPGEFSISDYGPTPAQCQLLDGVFISTLRQKLVQNSVMFDERFDFHFYDIDFCRTARQQDTRMGTWPIQLIHASPGGFGGDKWGHNLQKYMGKWTS